MPMTRPTSSAPRVKRVEDPRFITGQGRYLDDIQMPGDDPHGHPAQPVRARQHPRRSTPRPRRRCRASSPSSRARTSRTTRCRWPGRPAARRASRTTSTRPGSWPSTTSSGRARASPRSSPRRPSRRQDALEPIQVDWEPLPAVVDAEKATQPRRAAAPRERAQQHRVRLDGRRQGRARTRPSRRRGRRHASGSSTSG